uniref:Presequence protease mitochondrial-type C-terminal domain-containing protein n=1 Tax=Lotharella oceanica TaxID=641309 RepID=A0A7S2XEF0_9EUKA
MGGRMYQPGERVGGSTSVVTNFLKTGYLWDKVRVMGGAYGAGFSLNARLGTFAFSSYRDPNVKATIENYKKAADYLINAEIPKQEVERAIIGTISGLDYPQTPNGKGQTSFSRYFTGYTTEDAQRWRDEVLGTSAEDFKQFGLRLKKALETEGVVGVCAFGSNTALTNAKEEGLEMELKEAFAK